MWKQHEFRDEHITKSHIKYQFHRTKLGSIIAQENSQKSIKEHVNQTKISAHAFHPLQSMKLP